MTKCNQLTPLPFKGLKERRFAASYSTLNVYEQPSVTGVAI